MIEAKKNRLTKKIGLGHFDKDLMEKMYESTGIRPEFLQVELSVNNMRYDRIFYCQQHGIEVQAYEPLGDYESNRDHPLLMDLAKKYNTTIKNILLAFLMNQNIVPIITPENVEEIRDLLKSKEIILQKEDLEAMKILNTYKTKHFEGVELDFKDEK